MSVKARARIDLSAIRHNLNLVHKAAPQAKIAAVVKAGAYGHAILPTLKALDACDLYAVGRMEEAVDLRLAGVKKPILLLSGYVNSNELEAAIAHDLQLVIYHPQQLELLDKTDIPKPLTLWLKLDSGMHRLGLSPTNFIKAYQYLVTSSKVKKVISMTHFSSADEIDNPKTELQMSRFNECCNQLRALGIQDIETSTANSAAILAWPQTHGDWVRPGLMLYGVSPVNGNSTLSAELIPAMTFDSQVIAINNVGCNEAVGYNETWISQRESRIGVIAIGYGDGYPLKAQYGTPVLINGKRVPLVGKVSMDLITVDLTDFPDVQVGDRATLWGKDLSVAEIAKYANTIPYELLTGLTSRVKFEFIDH